MTTHEAKQIGIDAARACHHQWDGTEADAPELVFRHLTGLDIALCAANIHPEVDDVVYEAATEAFRVEAEELFGCDHVVAGQ